jgi:hypothetical protein
MSPIEKWTALGHKAVQFPLSPKALEKVAEERARVAADETSRPFDYQNIDSVAGWDTDFKKGRAALKVEKKKAEDMLVAIHHHFDTDNGVLVHVFHIPPSKPSKSKD